MRHALPILVALALLAPTAARGQSDAIESERKAEGEAPTPAPGDAPVIEIVETEGSAEDRLRAQGSTFVEVIEVGGQALGRSLSEVIQDAVGVQIQSLGGLGQFAQVSIRGSASDQVALFVDGVPVQRSSGGAVNLADYSLAQVERIEIYRGLPPPSLQGVPAGGAINIVTRRPEGRAVSAALTGGSFTTRGAQAALSQGFGARSLGLTLDYQGSAGDFPYVDDNGTPENLSDDVETPRRNNGFDHGSAHLRVLGPAGSADLDAFLSQRGIAGLANLPGAEATFTTGRLASTLALAPRGPDRLRLDASLSGRLQRERYTDPAGEVGLGRRDILGQTLSVGAAGSLTHVTTSRWLNTLSLGPRLEAYAQEDLLSAPATTGPGGRRLSLDALGSSDLLLQEGRIHLGPQVRALGLLDSNLGAAEGGPTGRVLVSPGLGIRATPTPGVWLRGSVGQGYRAPSFFELYGDRGAIVGNPELVPERVRQGEVGGSIEGRIGEDGRAFVELGGFYKDAQDLIQYVQNSQQTSKAVNISEASLYGGEARLSLSGARGDVRGNYTYLQALDRSDIPYYAGRTLPRRPRHDLFLGAGVQVLPGGGLRVGGDLNVISQTWLDRANLKPIPTRVLVGAQLEGRMAGDRLSATLRLENLLGTQVADFEGFPLPGRSAFLTLAWTGGGEGGVLSPES